MSQLRRNGVESKEALGSVLDSWAELTGGFDQVGCFGGKKGFFLSFSSWLSGVIHTWYHGTEFLLCTVEGCCNIHADVCGWISAFSPS